MIIKVIRDKSTPEFTLGEFVVYIRGVAKVQGHTVERPWKDNEPYISCIPTGTYKAFRRVSPSNGNVIELKDVPGRTHIQFHVANWAHDLEGCIGVGYDRLKDGVSESWDAMSNLYKIAGGKDIRVEIVDISGVPEIPKERGELRTIDPAMIPEWRTEIPVEWFEPVSYSNTLAEFKSSLRKRFERRQKARKLYNLVVSVAANVLRIPELGMLKIETQKVNYMNIIDRLKEVEKSTWSGLAIFIGLVLSYFGLSVDPELLLASAEGIAAGVGMVVVGATSIYEMLRKEKQKE